jgi:prevent-host-death family protein
MNIPAGIFKARCLSLMDRVAAEGSTLVVTKRGRPVVRIGPADPEVPRPLFGYLRSTAKIKGNIVEPLGEAWEAEQ